MGWGHQHLRGYTLSDQKAWSCMAWAIGDAEAEPGPIAASWHSNKFPNPVTGGAYCRYFI